MFIYIFYLQIAAKTSIKDECKKKKELKKLEKKKSALPQGPSVKTEPIDQSNPFEGYQFNGCNFVLKTSAFIW